MKRAILLFMLAGLVLAVLPFVNSAPYVVDDQYHWTCLSKGEKLVRYVCKSDCCITCQKNGYTAPQYRCSGLPYCSCGQSGNPVDLTPPEVTVSAPAEGSVFDSRSVEFVVSVDKAVDLFYKDSADERRGFRKICSRCSSFAKRISFIDGPHKITIKAITQGGASTEKIVNFFIDSKKPRIRKTLPKAKDYSNGTFVIEYDEDNLVRIKLMYDQGSGYKEVVKTNCPMGSKQECVFFVPGLNKTTLNYYFIVEDVVHTVQSKEVKGINIDTGVPTMTVTQPVAGTYQRSVLFDVDVSEEVTLEYIDYSSRTPRWSRLCSKCDNYYRKKSFSKGSHTIDIRATDFAGNSVKQTVSFTIE